MAGNDPGDTGAKPRRNTKPDLTENQRGRLKEDLKVLIDREKTGKTVDYIDEFFPEEVDRVRELVRASSDAVNYLTTSALHGFVSVDLAGHLGVWADKLQILKDVIDIQRGSGKQAQNLSPGAIDVLCRGLSNELVAKIDGHDYSVEEESAKPETEKKMSSVDDIFDLMKRSQQPKVRRTGPVLRAWGFAHNYKKTIHDLMAILPDKLGAATATATDKGTRRNKPEPEGDGKGTRRNKPEPEDGKAKRVNKPEPTEERKDKLTKAKLKKHLEELNGDTDKAFATRLIKKLQQPGDATLKAVIEEMRASGLPLPAES